MQTSNNIIWKTFHTVTWPNSPYQRIWEVSNTGLIRYTNTKTGRVKIVHQSLSGGHPGNRYLCLSLNNFKYVHRIVAETFIPNPDNLATVDHINGDKMDNRVENLRWMSHQENIKAYFANR